MKELTRTQTSILIGGDRNREARITKQFYKCYMGSYRACRRVERMLK